ncbi:MAG TPA: galactose oxidase-like domain-containing protein, partial [Pyrinomonadaceae bacterium]|nr:galactose oxidase-like domain-containing protein [Pyrinomonadaceae bacterium]
MKPPVPLSLQRLTRRFAFILCFCLLLLVAVPVVTISTIGKKEEVAPKGPATAKTALPQPLSPTAGARAPQGSIESATKGEFSNPVSWPIETPLMVHASMLPDGRILFWGRTKEGEITNNPTMYDLVGSIPTSIWNPATDGSELSHFEFINNTSTNLFCSGHSLLQDGRLFAAGGHAHKHPNSISGDNHTNIFDPVSRTWAPQGQPGSPPLMQQGRWYPFTLTLENGKIAILSGTYNIPPSEKYADAIKQWNPEIYDPQTNLLEIKGPLTDKEWELPNYPMLFLDPMAATSANPFRGVFSAGPSYSFFWNPTGAGTRSDIATHNEKHLEGSAVMYDGDEGRILITGGRIWSSNRTTAVSKTIRLADANPQWVATQPMAYPRTYHTSTVLPDGKVLVTGGVPCTGGLTHEPCGGTFTIGTTQLAEMWNPATGAWSAMDTGAVKRAYHSTALLLPDAKVLVAGGGRPDGLLDADEGDAFSNRRQTFAERRAEIYSPPYLFDDAGNVASRPSLNAAPAQVGYGQQFNLTFSNATGINRVAWIRLPSVTHGFNTDQRINVLNFSTTGTPGQLTVTAPSDPRKCPPGYYMLFIMEERGTEPNKKMVPSSAKIVRISSDVPPPPNLSINNVSQTEGNAGATNFNFTVSLSLPAPVGGVSFNIATADGTATAASGDYVARSPTAQTIPAGSSTYTFAVAVNGDTSQEANETFTVNVTSVTSATVTDGQGLGTIQTDDVTPNLSVNDVALTEGNTGTKTFTFTVGLSSPALTGGVTFNIATADGTATAASGDYTAKSLTAQTIPAGSTTYTFPVVVNGDTGIESNETFTVNLTSVTGATIADGQGLGTIQTDDVTPNLSINDVALPEGNAGTKNFSFTISLSSPAPAGGVNFNLTTADGTAIATSGDYTAKSLTGQAIPAGSSAYNFSVVVNGDTTIELNETFLVNVTNVTGATVTDGTGQGTIINDEVTPAPPDL